MEYLVCLNLGLSVLSEAFLNLTAIWRAWSIHFIDEENWRSERLIKGTNRKFQSFTFFQITGGIKQWIRFQSRGQHLFVIGCKVWPGRPTDSGGELCWAGKTEWSACRGEAQLERGRYIATRLNWEIPWKGGRDPERFLESAKSYSQQEWDEIR